MTVERFVEVSCDFCQASIGLYTDCSKKDARRWAKQEGARLHNDKDFCGDNCYWKWEDQQVQAANSGAADPEDPK